MSSPTNQRARRSKRSASGRGTRPEAKGANQGARSPEESSRSRLEFEIGSPSAVQSAQSSCSRGNQEAQRVEARARRSLEEKRRSIKGAGECK